MTVYKWKKGARNTSVDPQIVGEHLEELRETHGGSLKPADVVNDARPADALLNPLFEWDDGLAAEAYRQEQARGVMRSIVVQYETSETEQPKTVRAFVNIRDDDSRYTSTVAAMSDDHLRQQLLQRAWNDLLAWRKRYAEFEEFYMVFHAMADVEPRLQVR